MPELPSRALFAFCCLQLDVRKQSAPPDHNTSPIRGADGLPSRDPITGGVYIPLTAGKHGSCFSLHTKQPPLLWIPLICIQRMGCAFCPLLAHNAEYKESGQTRENRKKNEEVLGSEYSGSLIVSLKPAFSFPWILQAKWAI